MDYETLYASLDRSKPTVSLEEAREYLVQHVSILTRQCRETFFAIVTLFCKETGLCADEWFVYETKDEKDEVLTCESKNLPDKLVFMLYKFVQKSVENAASRTFL
jgi:hypothetical protein